MEPPEDEVAYNIYTKVVQVEQRFRRIHTRGFGGDAQFIESTLGWFIHFEGSFESLYVGFEPPYLKRGDNVRIRISKEPSCPPSTNTTPQT